MPEIAKRHEVGLTVYNENGSPEQKKGFASCNNIIQALF